MAKQTVTNLVDDLDGSPAQHTVRFTVDNYAYEIDLTGKHREELYDALEPFIRNGRQVRAENKKNGSNGKPRVAKTDREQLAAIRTWARENNHPVSSRGRISGTVVAAYEAYHRAMEGQQS